MKTVRGQQDGTRKRSPPPGHPPPLVPISKKTSSSPLLWNSTDPLTFLGRTEKPFTPYNDEVLRKLLGSCSIPSQFGRICQQREQQADDLMAHGHLAEQNVLGFNHLRRPYMDQATLDCRIREKALREPISTSNLLAEHMRYLPKAHSPQAYSEPLHAVPSNREFLVRPDIEGPLSLYNDSSFYPKSFHPYDYRSAGYTSAANPYSVPDQALALESRLLGAQY